ncbi:hypothetical protein ACX80S_14430 [Arthrobacter sp. RHLT1-20]
MGELELAGIAARLYSLPFDEFVAARTAAAKDASATKEQPSLAAEVRSLPKPSVTAWAVNMLAAQQPETLQELAALGTSMRAAQSALDAAELRRLGQARRQLLSGAVQAAQLLAEQQGRKISATIAAEVEETLRAATADVGAAVAVRSGRLLRGLSADGVDVVDLAGAVALPSLSAPADAAPVSSRVPARTSARTFSAAAETARAKQPRLRAVRQEPRTPTPSALERATAALQEAEYAARAAAEEAGRCEEKLVESTRLAAQLAGTVRSLREQLMQTERDLKSARKRQELSAAQALQAARAADKALRKEDLARERVLRLGNTPG